MFYEIDGDFENNNPTSFINKTHVCNTNFLALFVEVHMVHAIIIISNIYSQSSVHCADVYRQCGVTRFCFTQVARLLCSRLTAHSFFHIKK